EPTPPTDTSADVPDADEEPQDPTWVDESDEEPASASASLEVEPAAPKETEAGAEEAERPHRGRRRGRRSARDKKSDANESPTDKPSAKSEPSGEEARGRRRGRGRGRRKEADETKAPAEAQEMDA